LRAIHRKDSRRNQMRIPYEVRSHFPDHAVGLNTVGLSDSSGDSSSGHLAHGKLDTLFDQRIHFARLHRLARRAVHIDFGRLLGLRIGEFGLLGELLAVLRSNRVVVSKQCGLLARDDHHGQVAILICRTILDLQ
jgi:hypothetical protein